MNAEWYIARRLMFSKTQAHSVLRPVVRMLAASVALGTAAMIVSMSILVGFKRQITDKVTGFMAHIQISNYEGGTSPYETAPVPRNPFFLPQIKGMQGVRIIQPYALKAGVIAANDDIQGAVLKGITPDFDWTFFDGAMTQGARFALPDSASTNAVCISKTLAQMLRLRLGDRFDMYFVQTPPRVRRFRIEGIYDTQFGELDKLYVLCDIRHIQRLNNWHSGQVGGFEIFLNNFDDLDAAYRSVSERVYYTARPDSARFVAENIKQRYSQIFDWLTLLDLNALIIFVLMLLVAGFNMISGLLITTLERAQFIGLLSALGCRAAGLRRIFIYQSLYVAGRGLLWGNLAGIAICLAQRHWGIVALNPATYYLSAVPVSIEWGWVLALNAGTAAAIALMLVLPSMIIGKISPSRVLRFA